MTQSLAVGRTCNPWIGRTTWLSVSLSLLLLGCGGTVSQLSTEIQEGYRAQQHYGEGLTRYKARDYAGAVPLFRQALALQPSLEEARAYLAWSHYHLGEYAQATRHFRQAIARQPQWEGLHNGLGWTRYRMGRYHLALESFQRARDLDPRYRDADMGLAYCLFELGRYEEALPHLRRLTREGEGNMLRSPAPDLEHIRSRFAWTLFYLGDYATAREEFRQGIAARPDWYGLHNGLGWAALKLGDRAEATSCFRRALELKPGFKDAREGLVLAGS
ncbi:MAG TPA: tetratricopeptide repeat protein [Candidatus Methylomirabilis sp.]|nr:tetratricopeptide repeat protein [Candidatus Methylomirabilis sp.]